MNTQIVGGLVTLLVVSMLLIVGGVVYNGFAGSYSTGKNTSLTYTMSSDASSTINNTIAGTWDAFGLAQNVPLIVIAAVMIAIVVGAFVFVR